MNSSKADHFLVLGKVEKNVDHPDLFMNVLEMWATLMFQSLVQHSKNEPWLPTEVPRLKLKGLNVGLPLDTSETEQSYAEFESLKSADDKTARDYYLYYTDRRKFRESRRKDWEKREGHAAIGAVPEHAESSDMPPETADATEEKSSLSLSRRTKWIIGGLAIFCLMVALTDEPSKRPPRRK